MGQVGCIDWVGSVWLSWFVRIGFIWVSVLGLACLGSIGLG